MIVTVTTRGGIRPRRFAGICAAARTLGVTRQHLFEVLHGRRRSRRIERWLQRNMRSGTGTASRKDAKTQGGAVAGKTRALAPSTWCCGC